MYHGMTFPGQKEDKLSPDPVNYQMPLAPNAVLSSLSNFPPFIKKTPPKMLAISTNAAAESTRDKKKSSVCDQKRNRPKKGNQHQADKKEKKTRIKLAKKDVVQTWSIVRIMLGCLMASNAAQYLQTRRLQPSRLRQ